MTKSVLLVGSVPLRSSEDVFREVSERVGPLLKRVPDGETGDRSAWTAWQGHVIEHAEGVVRSGVRDVHGIPYPTYALKPGLSEQDIRFGDLGYANAAISSYRDFVRLRSLGLNRHARFQVSLPTPLAVVQAFFWGSPALPDICQVYETALLGEVDRILAAMPHAGLSLQWDIAVEFHRIWEKPESDLARQFPTPVLIETIARLGDHIPDAVELGWHFCYGDAGHKHFVEPHDTRLMVDIANKLTGATKRTANWLHLPVPRERSDAAYFAPLADLKLNPGTELYLGLIHLTDGLEGTKRRMAAADRFVADYGIATECGFGRRPPETILALLDLYQAAAKL
ncbi:hypothetical protein PY365_32340 [Roseiarcaceae bacterium H3SJ34-1]|uniref:hypothetical protein n=1 Tax=Terripilifer ovatus TaxID=3032367 RepID=UPI003AB9A223|nr:hypothetical protein [Roseiarcaceae bacterium H3SJ34-1]